MKLKMFVMLHIGNRIKEVMKQNDKDIRYLSGEIGSELSNTYRILKKENMDILLLKRISKALEYNFFTDLSKEFEKEKSK